MRASSGGKKDEDHKQPNKGTLKKGTLDEKEAADLKKAAPEKWAKAKNYLNPSPAAARPSSFTLLGRRGHGAHSSTDGMIAELAREKRPPAHSRLRQFAKVTNKPTNKGISKPRSKSLEKPKEKKIVRSRSR